MIDISVDVNENPMPHLNMALYVFAAHMDKVPSDVLEALLNSIQVELDERSDEAGFYGYSDEAAEYEDYHNVVVQ